LYTQIQPMTCHGEDGTSQPKPVMSAASTWPKFDIRFHNFLTKQ